MAVAPALADAFMIEGRHPLSGRIRAAGNKNGALPILAACLLTGEQVTLTNVPRIRDVDTMVELVGDLGGDASWTGPNELLVNAAGASKFAPDVALCSKMRASAAVAASTASAWRRSDSLFVYRVSVSQACSRVGPTARLA
jgi:UDP-N-acetylglucosamine 1-carboxyvinyltransferase